VPEFGFLKYFSEFCCEMLVRRDIYFDFGVEYFLQAWLGTVGIAKETFEPSSDN